MFFRVLDSGFDSDSDGTLSRLELRVRRLPWKLTATVLLATRLRRLSGAFALLVCLLLPSTARGQFGIANQDIVAMYMFNGQDEAGFKRQLETTCRLKLKRISSIVNLDSDQQSKIELAIRGDLNRFYRDMDVVRKKTEGLNIRDQADMQKAWQFMEPLYTRFRQKGVCGDESLFERVVETSLEPRQMKAYTDYLQRRQKRELEALIKVALVEVEKSIPLSQVQRERILELLETVILPKQVQQGSESYVGFTVLAKLQDDSLKEFLDEAQLEAFRKFKRQYQAGRFGGILW